MDVSENSGTPKSSILIGFSITNHPFWGSPSFGTPHKIPWSFVDYFIKSKVPVGILARQKDAASEVEGFRFLFFFWDPRKKEVETHIFWVAGFAKHESIFFSLKKVIIISSVLVYVNLRDTTFIACTQVRTHS